MHLQFARRALALPLWLLAGACAAQVMPDASSMSNAFADVARLSDADASCEQIYAEATWLEKRIAAQPKAPDPMEAAQQMQEDMRKARKQMMGGARARSLGSSLLSLVPGVGGLAAGAVSSIASRPNTDAIDAVMDKGMQAQQEAMAVAMRTAALQARREHLTNLFLERHCKVSTLDQVAVASARARLADGDDAGAAGDTPAAAPAE